MKMVTNVVLTKDIDYIILLTIREETARKLILALIDYATHEDKDVDVTWTETIIDSLRVDLKNIENHKQGLPMFNLEEVDDDLT